LRAPLPGIAHDGGPYQWYPGDEPGGYDGGFNTPADARPNRDWNICHEGRPPPSS